MDATLNSQINTFWEEDNTLISLLREWGVEYLVGLEPYASCIRKEQIPPIELITLLAQQRENPRIRDASISLFLLHPELVDDILEAIKTSKPEIAEQISTSTLAALYLQRMWSVRLTLALGHLPGFPEQPFAQLWQHRRLPPPTYHNGESGLFALQVFEQQRTGLPFIFTGDWQNQIAHLLWQEETRHREQTTLPIQLFEHNEEDTSEKLEMSMRPNVNKQAIESFLQQLGRTFRKQGRLYLVGGAALVHAGVRPGFTRDIAIQVSRANEDDLIITIQRLIRQMQINVEFASPKDFIPLPPQWEMHSHYISRYGDIDVFYFDFYSIALSKIERGTTRDIEDVKLLVQQKRIILSELDAAYEEVLAQLGKGRYPKITPERFEARYTSMRPLLL